MPGCEAATIRHQTGTSSGTTIQPTWRPGVLITGSITAMKNPLKAPKVRFVMM